MNILKVCLGQIINEVKKKDRNAVWRTHPDKKCFFHGIGSLCRSVYKLQCPHNTPSVQLFMGQKYFCLNLICWVNIFVFIVSFVLLCIIFLIYIFNYATITCPDIQCLPYAVFFHVLLPNYSVKSLRPCSHFWECCAAAAVYTHSFSSYILTFCD